jgi:hypothetical protein
MQNQLKTYFDGTRVYTETKTYVSGATTVTQQKYTGQQNGQREFSFTGFGSSGKPPYKVPTAGTYLLRKYSGKTGRKSTVDWTWNPKIVREDEGSIAGNGSWADKESSFDGTVYNRAITKLYENIRQSESNLALTIGEARETGRMLQVGRSLAEIVSTARRAKRQFLMNPSKTLSSVWLSYQYGWRPLFMDIYGYLNWTYSLLNEGIPVIGRATRKENANIIQSWSNPYPGVGTTTGVRLWRCEAKCWVGVSDSAWFNLARITSLNPLSIAWELVPLSFVADWFYDVGGYLQNMEASLGTGVSFKRGYVTQLYYHNLSQ